MADDSKPELEGYKIGADRALPESDHTVIERRVLFALCALGKCADCSGWLQSQNCVTVCTCQCHIKTALPEST